MTVTVLIVDDVAPLRTLVRRALELRGGFNVVADVRNGLEAIAAASAHQPDVVVLDLGLPDLPGRELLARLRAVAPATRVVVYTGSVGADRAEVLADVAGFVRKDQELSYLVDLVGDIGRAAAWDAAVLENAPESVAAARRFVDEFCARARCLQVRDDARLIVSELVTNALVHAGSRCEVRCRVVAAVLRLEVLDEGRGSPDPQRPSPDEDHGRGLLLIGVLAAAWGVEAAPDGRKVVWAELPLGAPDPGDAHPLYAEGGC